LWRFSLASTGYTIQKMPKKKQAPAQVLKGWAAIAKFMGTTPASAQTWAKQGMPVKREGRFTVADPAEVQAWLGRQSHMPKPAHILTNDTDIAAALRESISVVKRQK
jgi:phage terminase Nu1 subunit (DNA packaging protein)